jgi:hypothetical protein
MRKQIAQSSLRGGTANNCSSGTNGITPRPLFKSIVRYYDTTMMIVLTITPTKAPTLTCRSKFQTEKDVVLDTKFVDTYPFKISSTYSKNSPSPISGSLIAMSEKHPLFVFPCSCLNNDRRSISSTEPSHDDTRICLHW